MIIVVNVVVEIIAKKLVSYSLVDCKKYLETLQNI